MTVVADDRATIDATGELIGLDDQPSVTFADLGVDDKLAEALRLRRILEPFDIQRLVIPDAVAGRDILGRAPTGSGKTLGFGVPSLQRLIALPRAEKRRPRALILSPTRELAEQIAQELEPLAQAIGRRVQPVYGGVSPARHVKALAKGVDLLVACPGRLLDLIDQGAVDLGSVEVAVVDEADRMADMGFLPDVRSILDQTGTDPAGNSRQVLLFSATLDNDVQVLVDRYQRDPVIHEVGEVEPDLSLMDHRFIEVVKTQRAALAADLIAQSGPTVVFVRTRHGADRLARQLRNEGVSAGHIHGGRSQSQRDRALEVFTDGRVSALVATDVAARGIHVDGVACVIHYDPPAETKDYVHRSGRTARAGAAGTVISFLEKPQVKGSRKMQRELGITADLESAPEPIDRDRSPVVIGNDRQSASAGNQAPRSKSRTSGPKRSPRNRSGEGAPSGRDRSRRKDRSDDPSTVREGTGHEARGKRPSKKGPTDGARGERSETGRSRSGRPEGAGAGEGRSGEGRPSGGRPGRPSGRKGTGRGRTKGFDRRSETGRPDAGSGPGRARRTDRTEAEERSGEQTARPRKKSGAPGGAGSARPGAKPTTGSGAKASKRSGKARPRNRKNKSGFRRRDS